MTSIDGFYPDHDQWLMPLLHGHELGSILEVGCGQGRTLAWLSQQFPRTPLTGIERRAEAAQFARERMRGAATVLEADAMSFRAEPRFDLAVFYLSLHDADEPLALLKRAPELGDHVVVVDIAEYLPDANQLFAEAGWASANVSIHPDEHVVTAWHRFRGPRPENRDER
jgi:trans-aconitate methyltransferase